MIVVLWRGGLRIQEALDLTESDLDARRGSILVRAGKGSKRREVGMDPWALERPPRPVGRVSHSAAARAAVLRDRRSDRRAAMVSDRGSAQNCAATSLRPGSGAAWRPISPAMLTLSSSPGKACPYPQSSGASRV